MSQLSLYIEYIYDRVGVVPQRLRFFNTWSSVGGAVCIALGGVDLLEEVSLGVGFEDANPHIIPTSLSTSYSWSRCKLLASSSSHLHSAIMHAKHKPNHKSKPALV